MEKKITLPLDREVAKSLRVGDSVLISGDMLVFRDAGHKRLFESIKAGKPDINYVGETIYFMGPCPALPGQVMGSCGPTTSGRMDKYTPYMFDTGLAAQIGKGKRSDEVRETMKECTAVYFGAIGGAGAVLANSIKKAEVIAYEDLGAEAIRRLEVEDMPLFVIMDCYGGNLYESGRKEYLESVKK